MAKFKKIRAAFGLAVGPSHEKGGISGSVKGSDTEVEFEGGERIIEKGDTTKLDDLANLLNVLKLKLKESSGSQKNTIQSKIDEVSKEIANNYTRTMNKGDKNTAEQEGEPTIAQEGTEVEGEETELDYLKKYGIQEVGDAYFKLMRDPKFRKVLTQMLYEGKIVVEGNSILPAKGYMWEQEWNSEEAFNNPQKFFKIVESAKPPKAHNLGKRNLAWNSNVSFLNNHIEVQDAFSTYNKSRDAWFENNKEKLMTEGLDYTNPEVLQSEGFYRFLEGRSNNPDMLRWRDATVNYYNKLKNVVMDDLNLALKNSKNDEEKTQIQSWIGFMENAAKNTWTDIFFKTGKGAGENWADASGVFFGPETLNREVNRRLTTGDYEADIVGLPFQFSPESKMTSMTDILTYVYGDKEDIEHFFGHSSDASKNLNTVINEEKNNIINVSENSGTNDGNKELNSAPPEPKWVLPKGMESYDDFYEWVTSSKGLNSSYEVQLPSYGADNKWGQEHTDALMNNGGMEEFLKWKEERDTFNEKTDDEKSMDIFEDISNKYDEYNKNLQNEEVENAIVADIETKKFDKIINGIDTGDLLRLGQIGMGIAGATKDMPNFDWDRREDYEQYMDDTINRAKYGLTPLEEGRAKTDAERAYAYSRLMMDESNMSPAQRVALGQVQAKGLYDAYGNVAILDEATRMERSKLLGPALLNDYEMAKDTFNLESKQIEASKLAGAELAGAGIDNLLQSNQFKQAYGPDSEHAKGQQAMRQYLERKSDLELAKTEYYEQQTAGQEWLDYIENEMNLTEEDDINLAKSIFNENYKP